jgi:hypothetical protein
LKGVYRGVPDSGRSPDGSPRRTPPLDLKREYATATNTEKLTNCEVTGLWAIEQANGDVDPESRHVSGATPQKRLNVFSNINLRCK